MNTLRRPRLLVPQHKTLFLLLICIWALQACANRNQPNGWTSYSVWGNYSPMAWISPNGSIWVVSGYEVFRVDGDELAMDHGVSALVDNVDQYLLSKDPPFWVPTRPGYKPMSDIWGTTDDDIWIDSVLHFDGRKWTRVPGKSVDDPKPFGGRALYGVDPSFYLHLNDCGWEQWDGQRWTAGEFSSCQWNSLHGTGRNDIYASSGEGRIAHFDGVSWQNLNAPLASDFYTLWARSPVEIYVGGLAENGQRPTLFLFDGTTWQEIASPTQHIIKQICSDGEFLYVADEQAVYQRDSLGQWLEILRLEPYRNVGRMRVSNGVLSLGEYSSDSRTVLNTELKVWIRR